MHNYSRSPPSTSRRTSSTHVHSFPYTSREFSSRGLMFSGVRDSLPPGGGALSGGIDRTVAALCFGCRPGSSVTSGSLAPPRVPATKDMCELPGGMPYGDRARTVVNSGGSASDEIRSQSSSSSSGAGAATGGVLFLPSRKIEAKEGLRGSAAALPGGLPCPRASNGEALPDESDSVDADSGPTLVFARRRPGIEAVDSLVEDDDPFPLARLLSRSRKPLIRILLLIRLLFFCFVPPFWNTSTLSSDGSVSVLPIASAPHRQSRFTTVPPVSVIPSSVANESSAADELSISLSSTSCRELRSELELRPVVDARQARLGALVIGRLAELGIGALASSESVIARARNLVGAGDDDEDADDTATVGAETLLVGPTPLKSINSSAHSHDTRYRSLIVSNASARAFQRPSGVGSETDVLERCRLKNEVPDD
ncbi:unnamed protein product [Mycena citricolor]|uniref:Uncharacterized protein n=1 Tax=Mycena citricolor TaxID=2018698 RepID=A0AAD2Q3H0_9AGAR|nr:unnamed protein product [Mycena citricolor]